MMRPHSPDCFLHGVAFMPKREEGLEKKSIEDLQQTIEMLQQENFQLREIIENVPGDVYWKDLNGVWLGINARGSNSLKEMGFLFNPHDVIGKTDVELFGEAVAKNFKANDQQVIQEKREISNEEIATLPSGEKITQLSIKRPLYDSNRKIVGIIGNTVDITYLKNIENSLRDAKDKAEAANKAKTEFLENMRHDIRTPLIGIIGFASVIAEEVNDLKVKEHVGNLVTSSYALLDLLNEILDVIKIGSGEIPLVKKKFALNNRLSAIIDLNKSQAAHKKLNLIYQYDETIPPYLIGDPTRVHRIALELIVNALNFTHQGVVKLETKLAQTNEHDVIVKLIVEDTGIGIEPEKQQEIFIQFRRLTPSYEGIYKGVGLGLTIVKQFIDELQGEIYIESQVGVGTRFTCILPFKKPLLNEEFGSDKTLAASPRKKYAPLIKEKTTHQVPAKEQVLGKSHILVVEDQPIAAQVVSNMLLKLECKVDVAPDGKIAIERIKENGYDLVFMDIGLPELDGYKTTQQIRLYELSKNSHVPIIALTAHVDDENKKKCLDVGMNAVVTKPLTKEKAEEILNAFIPYREKFYTNKQIEQSTFPPIERKIIDIELMKDIFNGKDELIDEMLTMLMDSFSEELAALDQYLKEGNWLAIRDIAHKLKGGASYCGTTHLKEACSYLEACIKAGKEDLYVAAYKQMLQEMALVEDAVRNKDY